MSKQPWNGLWVISTASYGDFGLRNASIFGFGDRRVSRGKTAKVGKVEVWKMEKFDP